MPTASHRFETPPPPPPSPSPFPAGTKLIQKRGGWAVQVCFIGVTNPLDPRVETPEEVRDALVEAAKYIPVERLGSTDDCGFSPFSDDRKPRHGDRPDAARQTAFRKIAARVKGTELASAILCA